MLRKLFIMAANNPKKAAGIFGASMTVFGGAGYSIPDWLVPALIEISKAALWLAEFLQHVGPVQ